MGSLRIVSHNAFWFQGAPFPTDRPGRADEAVMAGVMEIYRRLKPHVLAIQEVQDEATFERLSAGMGMSGGYCPGGELGQYGGAMLFAAGQLDADGRSADPLPQRMWQIASVRLGDAQAIAVCNIHLPSSRQLGASAAEARRIEELRCALTAQGRPAVVVGDFNELPGGPVGECLTAAGYADAAVLTGQADRATALGGGRGDQIWLNGDVRDRLIAYGVMEQRDMSGEEIGKESLSDHFPLWLDLA